MFSVSICFLFLHITPLFSSFSQLYLETQPIAKQISFQSWNGCDEVDEGRGIYPKIVCRGGDNTYHEFVIELYIGQPAVDKLASETQNITIPIRVSSEFKDVEALSSPETCLAKTDGECLLLNQGEAKLKIILSQLEYSHTLSPTPEFEIPYDYFVKVINIPGGNEIMENLSSSSGSVEGINCFLYDGDPADRFITGERCAPLICPCGAITDILGDVDGETNQTKNLFAEVHGLLPSCGVFKIENETPMPQYSGLFEFTHENESGDKTFKYNISFTTSNPDKTFDSVDATRSIQLIIELMKDPVRYSKPFNKLPGAIVICNWDGRYQWDGPNLTSQASQINFRSIFPIPLTTGGFGVAREWTNAAWFYVDDYTMLFEYQRESLGHNGVTMLDILNQIDSFYQFYDRTDPTLSQCCQNYPSPESLDSFIRTHLIPPTTPKDIITNPFEYGASVNGRYGKAFAFAHTKFRSSRPGSYPVVSDNGVPVDIFKDDFARLTTIQPLLNYRIFAGDYPLDYSSLYQQDLRKPIDINNFPTTLSVRRPANIIEVLPFSQKITDSTNNNMQSEIVLQATLLISDVILSGRRSDNKTFVPYVRTIGDKIKCNVSPFGRILELNGLLCNAGSRTTIEPDDLFAEIKCTLPAGLKREFYPDGPKGFVHRTGLIAAESILPRQCLYIRYTMNATRSAPSPLDDISAFVYGVGSEESGLGTCEISFFYKAKLNPVFKNSTLKGGVGYTEILVGYYNAITCVNIDIHPSDPESDGLYVKSNWMWTAGKIPDQCKHEWDLFCMLSGRMQPGEDAGGSMFLILLFSLLGGIVVAVSIISIVHYKRVEDITKSEGAKTVSRRPVERKTTSRPDMKK